MARARSATRGVWLVRLYPAGWRERYEDEFMALLEDARPSLTDFADILLGALDARLFLRDATGGTLTMLTRYRAANIAVFCSWILFVLAGLALNWLCVTLIMALATIIAIIAMTRGAENPRPASVAA